MSEEGPAPAMASATDHEYSSHSQQPIHVAPNPPVNTSRKSTLTKSQFEVHVDGTHTPMSNMGANRGSRHMLDLDDYFVRLAIIRFSIPARGSIQLRDGMLIWRI